MDAVTRWPPGILYDHTEQHAYTAGASIRDAPFIVTHLVNCRAPLAHGMIRRDQRCSPSHSVTSIWLGSLGRKLRAESLRLFFLTSASALIWKFSKVSHHKMLGTLHGYVRWVDLFK